MEETNRDQRQTHRVVLTNFLHSFYPHFHVITSIYSRLDGATLTITVGVVFSYAFNLLCSYPVERLKRRENFNDGKIPAAAQGGC